MATMVTETRPNVTSIAHYLSYCH